MNQEEEEKNTEAKAEQTAEEPKTSEETSVAVESQSTGDGKAGGTEAETKGTEEKPWKTQENARFAQMRRENEELRKRLDAMQSERRENITEGTLKELGFTREDLADDENMKVATAYTKALADGVENPKAYAYESVYRSNREAERKARAEADRNAHEQTERAEKVRQDVEAFHKAYPDIDINEVVKDGSEFSDLFGDVPDVIGNVTKYYGKYLRMKGIQQGRKPLTEADKAKGSPYVKGGQSASADGGRLTEAQIMKLSPEEFDNYMRNVVLKGR